MPWILKGSIAVPQLRGLDKVVGTNMEPFLRGFQECSFQVDVQEFVERHARTFAVACPDGSHPLVWTEVHLEYKQMFEKQLDAILEDLDIEQMEFLEWVEALKETTQHVDDDYALPGTDGLLAAYFDDFLQALTASDDYESFLMVMYHEVGKLLACEPSTPSNHASSQGLQVSVTAPEYSCPGQVINVQVLGVRHGVEIPSGYPPGSTFQAVVTQATQLPHAGYCKP